MVVTNEKVSGYIRDDIAFSILSKLPNKSVKRFECACKSWSLLFENPHFMTMFCNIFLFSKHSSYNDGTSLLLNHVLPYRADHPSQSVLYSISCERFENKVQLNWPKPFNGDGFHLGFYIFGSVSVNGVLCLY